MVNTENGSSYRKLSIMIPGSKTGFLFIFLPYFLRAFLGNLRRTIIMQKAFFIFFCLLCCSQVRVAGQSLLQPMAVQGEPLGVKQGLSQGMINCIYQDKEGYLWIATKDGLNRYDGYNITTYRHNPNDPYSLPDNYCNKMLEDNHGNFWAGTNTRGLSLFDKATERFYPATFFNSSNENQCIRNLQYDNGQLFVETWTNALIYDISRVDFKKDGAAACAKARLLCSYNQLQPNKRFIIGQTSNYYYGIHWIPGQCLWVDFLDSIFQLRPQAGIAAWEMTAYAPAALGLEGKRKFPAYFFPMPGDTGKMIICIDDRVAYYDLAAKKIYSRSLLPPQKKGGDPAFFQTNDGSISTAGDTAVLIFRPQTKKAEWIPFGLMGTTGTGFIRLLKDTHGMEWFGSPGFGMAKKDTRKQGFKSFSTGNNAEVFAKLPSAIMPHIPQQWVETYDCRQINAFVLDKKGVYWCYLFKERNIAGRCDLLSFDTKSGILRKHPGLTDDTAFRSSVYNDPQDRLWIHVQSLSGKNRIARIDKNTGSAVAEYIIPDNINTPDNFVSQYYWDKKGVMWLATVNGLYAMDEKTKAWKHWKNIPDNNSSLSADKLLSICPDPVNPDQYLWIGTEGAGINRFDKATGNCIRYNEEDGLPNNVAYCILSDSLNNLWISTNKGLSCLSPLSPGEGSGVRPKAGFRNFTDEDGLPGNEFNRHSAMYMPNGELMFGGVDGFVIFNPKEVLQKQPAAPIVFTGFTIFNKPIHWKTDSSNLKAPPGYAQTLTLLPGQNIFSISFATLEFRSNAKKMYSYRLEGFDKDWTAPGNKNEVTYTNLSPGTYAFYVKGANTDGVWNEKPVTIEVMVLPFWYQTIWFRIFIFLLVAAALFGLYRYRLKQALKIEKLRNRIARDLHDEIGSTLSSISIYAESVKKVTPGNQKAENILSRINASTTEMMEAMSDIVWAVNSNNDHFDELANRLRSFAVQVTEVRQIELFFTDNQDLPDMLLNMEQRKNIYLIGKEAISNAVKYSGCTNLNVEITRQNNSLVIQICDNGKGFELATPGKAAAGHSFGGNGIKNMRSRAAEIGAELNLASEPGKGTCITVRIPLKKS